MYILSVVEKNFLVKKFDCTTAVATTTSKVQ